MRRPWSCLRAGPCPPSCRREPLCSRDPDPERLSLARGHTAVGPQATAFHCPCSGQGTPRLAQCCPEGVGSGARSWGGWGSSAVPPREEVVPTKQAHVN